MTSDRWRPVSRRPPGSRTGMVLRTGGRHATVLVPGGGIVRLRLDAPGARPGDEVLLPQWVLQGAAPPAVQRFRVTALAACALALALLLSSLSMYLNPLPAVAMVSLDINPGVTLWVNSVMRVVSVQAVDEAGQRLLQGLTPAHRPLSEVVSQIVDRAAGELPAQSAGQWLVIAAAPTQPDEVLSSHFLSVLDELKEHALQRLGESLGVPEANLHGAVIEVPREVATEARDHGISPGEYALALAAQESGADVRIDDVRLGDIMSAVKGAGLNPPELLEHVKTVSLEAVWQKYRDKVKTARPPETGPSAALDPATAKPDPPGGPPSSPGPGPGTPAGPGSGGETPGQGEGGAGPAGGAARPPETEEEQYPIIKGGGPGQRRERWEEVIDRLRRILGDKATERSKGRGGH